MSDTQFDLREQLARIDRAMEEKYKFRVEQGKLTAERDKLSAEREKLAVEALKLSRDRILAPWQMAIVMIGSIGGFFGGAAGVIALLKTVGVL